MSLPLYIALFAAALGICILCSRMAVSATRSCPDCGRQTPVHGRRCRYCGYLLGRV